MGRRHSRPNGSIHSGKVDQMGEDVLVNKPNGSRRFGTVEQKGANVLVQ